MYLYMCCSFANSPAEDLCFRQGVVRLGVLGHVLRHEPVSYAAMTIKRRRAGGEAVAAITEKSARRHPTAVHVQVQAQQFLHTATVTDHTYLKGVNTS